ncbi:MAG TPA: PAS domain-containing sensor histidine kinase, partial [Archangium sp.]
PPTPTGTFEASPWSGRDTLVCAQFDSLWEAPIGLAFLDEQLRYVRVNKTLATLNGVSPEAHLGRCITEVLPAISPVITRLMERVLATGTPVIDAVLTGRTPATPEEDHHYLASYYPVRDEAGALVGLGATIHDITGWRRAELSLHQSESRFRSLVLATAQVVWTTDPGGQVVEECPSWRAFTGQGPKEELGWGWLEAIHPEDRPQVRLAWQEATRHAQAQSYRVEYRLRRPDGSFTPTLARGVPVLNPDGSLREWVGTNADISGEQRAREERERLLEELRRAMHARDAFLTVAAHELRTPLTTLGLRLQTLWRETRGEPGTRFTQRVLEQAEAMRRQVKRLTDLVNGLMEAARSGEGLLPLELEDVELCALVARVAAELEPEAARARCTLELEAECAVPGRWDRARLEQVLIHLLSNALKYGAGRPVRVHVSRVEERARLTVRDEGIGIAPEHLPRIFGRFERAVSERHYGGLGLGLYMTRRLVEALGGTVHVESTPGAGTTFTVELPLRPPARGGPP